MFKIKHGKRKTRLYRIWANMKTRCYNPNYTQYKDYGGRGITVCNEWKNDFQAFYDWSISNGYNDILQIDRIDNNKSYEPSNCRWVDRKTQGRNKRNNRNYTINGETHCLSEWCLSLGLKNSTVRMRLDKYNWTIEKALELEDKQ